MTTAFDPTEGLVVVRARLTGPTETAVVQLALDTGATSTMIGAAILQIIGCDPGASEERVRVTTGSGVEYVPRVRVRQIESLGRITPDFPVLSHTLPPSAGVDGLLGLDYLRGLRIIIDFRAGQIDLG